jgi:signal transduction histidine kinase
MNIPSGRHEPLVLRPIPVEAPEAPADPIVFGVASQLAWRTGAGALSIRAAFGVLALCGGFGIGAYLLLAWAFRGRPLPECATPKPIRDIAIAIITFGVAAQLSGWWPGVLPQLVYPIAIVAIGIVIAWNTSRPSTTTNRTPAGWIHQNRISDVLIRLVAGAVLFMVGAGVFLSQRVGLDELRDAGIAAGVAIAGIALIAAPSLVRLVSNITAEREQRVSELARAEMAAHVHDSVLQTLTLIQRRSNDPIAVAMLVRRQERDLRRWLYEQGPDGRAAHDTTAATWRAQLQTCADEVEDLYRVTVEVVAVGDRPMDAPTEALLAAAREAMTNAAKFSGEPTIAVFAECESTALTVFVRDRGIGFDPTTLAADRMGISESIHGRMRRAGGTAAIRSAHGDGTEVELRIPLTATTPARPTSPARPTPSARPTAAEPEAERTRA